MNRRIPQKFLVITTRKRSLGQGNIFAPVCHSVHRGRVPGQVPPRQVHPPGQVPPRQVHPLPRQVHPHQCMLGYGQQAGSTHPTGMHSCLLMTLKKNPGLCYD